jgi:hypothetical protein
VPHAKRQPAGGRRPAVREIEAERLEAVEVLDERTPHVEVAADAHHQQQRPPGAGHPEVDAMAVDADEPLLPDAPLAAHDVRAR